MSSAALDEHRPTTLQLRVLELVHETLPARWSRSALEVSDEFRHWEDEDPSGAHAWFDVSIPPFNVYVGTPFSWEGRSNVIVVRFATYDRGDGDAPPWAVLEDSTTRQRLLALGCKRWGGSHSWEIAWTASEVSSSDISRAIVTTVERLAEIPFRIVRPADLGSPAKWPQMLVFDLLAADEVVAERVVSKNVEWKLRFSFNGEHQTAQVSEETWNFVREARQRLKDSR